MVENDDLVKQVTGCIIVLITMAKIVFRWKTVSVSLLGLLLDKLTKKIDGHGEDDGGVVLRGYCAQRLEISQLKYIPGFIKKDTNERSLPLHGN